MVGKYGTFSNEQLKQFKKKLHSKVHWLLIYKENDKCNFYDKYFTSVMKYFNSLNTVLGDNANILDILVVLQMAYEEVQKEDFDFGAFKKYIFEAHNIIDRL